MAQDLPDYLKSGEPARLIPVATASHKERQAASALLATLGAVKPFAEEVLGALGRRVGTRTEIKAYIEVVFRKSPSKRDIRPDGLLCVDTGRSRWTALIEAKIGTANIELPQIHKYIELAELNNVDSVITISNQFTAFPDQHPVSEINDINTKVKIYHFSWMRLVTLATLLTSSSEQKFTDGELFIVRELIRFFEHSNIDVHGFSRMSPHWKDLISGTKAGRQFKNSDIEILDTVRSWHQEQQDICLILSRNLGIAVRLTLPRKYRDNGTVRIEDDAATLTTAQCLTASFNIPNAAGDLVVIADISTRTIRCSMAVRAPEDRKSHEARLNWLLRQLPDDVPAQTYVHVLSRSVPKVALVSDLLDDPNVARPDNPKVLPASFEVSVVTDLAGRFSNRRVFIETLESAVPAFYDRVAKHIKEWRSPPPRGPATRAGESLQEAIDRLSGARPRSEKIIKRGTISGRRFAIFENGSIEVETSEGVKWFEDLDSLKNFIGVPG